MIAPNLFISDLTKGFSPEREDARFRQAPRGDASEDAAAERKPEDDFSERGIG